MDSTVDEQAVTETVAFKIPSDEIDRAPGRLVTSWDEGAKRVTLLYSTTSPRSRRASMTGAASGRI